MNGEEMRGEKVKNLHQQIHMAMPQNSWTVRLTLETNTIHRGIVCLTTP